MKISIITVCYNAAKTIRDALESVCAQAQKQGTGVEIDLIREVAMKPIEMLTDEDKWHIVSAIEATKTVVLQQPTEERIRRFVRGYWDGDPKTIREIVEWGGAVVPPRVENRYIGEIQTHRNSIRSILFHTRFRGPLKVLVLEHLTEILRDAVLYNKGTDDGETFYNLAHRLSFDPGDGNGIREFVARLTVKETADGNRTWTIEFSNKKELTGVPTTGEAATVEVTRLKPPSTHTILKWIYGVNGGKGTGNGEQGTGVAIEHIVVDGGSTDGTVREIEDFAKEVGEGLRRREREEGEGEGLRRREREEGEGEGLRRRERGGGGEWNYSFRWVSEKDRGLYDGMNKGIRMATGDVIGILNADDMMAADDVLLKVAERFEKQPDLEFLYSDVRFVDESATLAKLHETDTRRYICPIIWRPWMLTFGYAPPHPGMYIRRSCFEKWGYYKYEYRIGADYEMTVRFTRKHKARRAYMRKCAVAMRLGGSSTERGNVGSFVGNNYDVINANRENGYWGNRWIILGKLPVKALELIVPKFNRRIGA